MQCRLLNVNHFHHVDIPWCAAIPLEAWCGITVLVFIICALSGGYIFLSTLSFIKISQQEEIPKKKSGKGQVPGRDTGKKTHFHP